MTVEEFQKEIVKFRDERDWKQFHNPKDLAISLSLEANELMEHFQWKSEEEVQEYLKTHKDEVADELSDTFYWVLLIAADLDIDLKKAFERKMKINAAKYPVKKAKGKHTKYKNL